MTIWVWQSLTALILILRTFQESIESWLITVTYWHWHWHTLSLSVIYQSYQWSLSLSLHSSQWIHNDTMMMHTYHMNESLNHTSSLIIIISVTVATSHHLNMIWCDSIRWWFFDLDLIPHSSGQMNGNFGGSGQPLAVWLAERHWCCEVSSLQHCSLSTYFENLRLQAHGQRCQMLKICKSELNEWIISSWFELAPLLVWGYGGAWMYKPLCPPAVPRLSARLLMALAIPLWWWAWAWPWRWCRGSRWCPRARADPGVVTVLFWLASHQKPIIHSALFEGCCCDSDTIQESVGL